ncbi:20063_t:CDS:2, partial [Funneliformis geosporum]
MHIPTILIIGAGPGGLLLYHGIQKHLNKNEKKFNVKIFERDTDPRDRWQGFSVAINSRGMRSLISCLPKSLVTRLPEVMPIPISEKDCYGILVSDDRGNELLRVASAQVRSLFELPNMSNSTVATYRDRLRDLMLEGVNIQWRKKCIGYDECNDEVWAIFEDGTRERGDILIGCDGIHSPIRKQRLPYLRMFDYGITQIVMKFVLNKRLVDRIIMNGNSLTQQSISRDGDALTLGFRLIPIEVDITANTSDDQIHYPAMIHYAYYTHWDTRNQNVHVNDDDPQSVIDHVKNLIKQHRRPSKLTDLYLELLSLVPVSSPKEFETSFFKTYNPPRRKPLLDINPRSIEPWESTRVTLLGDAIHAMNPVLGLGTNSALLDADLLVKCLSNYEKDGYKQCIQNYENILRIRASRE